MKKTRIPGKIADLLRMNDAQQILAEVGASALVAMKWIEHTNKRG